MNVQRPASRNDIHSRPDGLSIIILLYRDEMTVQKIVEECLDLASSQPYINEIVLVNSCSPDRSGEIAHRLAVEHPQLVRAIDTEAPGYALAVITGLQEACSTHAVVLDGDLEYSPSDIPHLFERCSRADFVLSFRYAKRYSPSRRFISAIYNALVRSTFRVHFRDVGSGLRIYAVQQLQGFQFSSSSAFLAAEIPVKLALAGMNYAEVGIPTFPSPHRRTAVARPAEILRVARDLAKCRKSVFSHEYAQDCSSRSVGGHLPTKDLGPRGRNSDAEGQ